MTKTERKNSLMPSGIPKWIRCYDNGGAENGGTLDRYTVVFTKKACTNLQGDRWFLYVGMNAAPFHPQGIGQHGETNNQPADRPTYGHLGKKIRFEDLPEDCKKLVISDYIDLWDIGINTESDKLPTVLDYTNFLKQIVVRKNITKEEARTKYGQFTYKQWYELLKYFS